MRSLYGITVAMDMSLRRLQELVMDREGDEQEVHGVTESWTWLSNWAELKISYPSILKESIKTKKKPQTSSTCVISTSQFSSELNIS